MKILAILTISLALTGCTTAVADKWRNVQRDGNDIPRSRQLTLAFEPNGSITVPAPGGSRKTIGKYTVKDDHLSLESDGQIVKYRYEMTPNTLRLQNEERKNRYLLFVRENRQ